MKKALLFPILILFVFTLAAKQVHVFENLVKPAGIICDPADKYLYIPEFPQFHVYSAVDYSLVKSFGKQDKVLLFMFDYYPWSIRKGKLFQLLENDDEEWVLHSYEIDKLKTF